MGENQLKVTHDADTKLGEQIQARMFEKEEKYQLNEQARLEKKKKTNDELRLFFEKHVIRSYLA